MVEIKQQLVPMNNRNATFGTGNPQTKMIVHQTGNTQRGANAKMHADLQSSGFPASWHIQSDDKDIIQSWPLTYRLFHASTGARANGGNMVGIGWEICINADGDYLASLLLAAKGIAKVMRQVGMPMSGLTTHNAEDWEDHKWCPAQILSGVQGVTWPKFVQMVKNEYNRIGNTATGIEWVEEDTGSFLSTRTFDARDIPSLAGKTVATFKPKDVLEVYDRVHYGEGQVWLEYSRPGKTPAKAYLPIRTFENGVYGNMRGEIGEIGKFVISKKPTYKVEPPKYIIKGQGHIESKGWVPMRGNTVGTIGIRKRLEAFSITVQEGEKLIPIFGEVHLQGLGDVSVHTNVFGTVGEKRRMEAVKLDIADDIEYRVHMETTGWSNWTENNTWAGTKGKERRIEAIEFRIK